MKFLIIRWIKPGQEVEVKLNFVWNVGDVPYILDESLLAEDASSLTTPVEQESTGETNQGRDAGGSHEPDLGGQRRAQGPTKKKNEWLKLRWNNR